MDFRLGLNHINTENEEDEPVNEQQKQKYNADGEDDVYKKDADSIKDYLGDILKEDEKYEEEDDDDGENVKKDGESLIYRLMSWICCNYKDFWVGIVYAIFIILNIKFVVLEIYSFVYVDTSSIKTSPVTFFVMVSILAFTWLYSTSREYWNFNVQKMLGIYIIAITCLLRLSWAVYYLLYSLSIPYISKMVPDEIMTESKIAGLCWIATLIPLAIFVILTSIKVFGGLRINKQMICDFKIKHYLQKIDKYEYTIKCLRYIENGKAYVVGMRDRFLHVNITGATGTAKTSSIIVPIINDDLNTKILNEDEQKKAVEKFIKSGKAYIVKPFKDKDYSEGIFNKGYIKPIQGYEKEFTKVINKFRSAGITIVGPDPSLSDSIYELCENKGIKCSRIDPVREEDGKLKRGSKGFNPLFISPLTPDWARRKEMVKKATLVADVMQAMFEMGGKSDPFFSSVNRIATSTVCMVVMMVHPLIFNGETPTLKHVQTLINDFNKLNLYLPELVRYNNVNGNCYDAIVDTVKYQFLATDSKGVNKFSEHCTGLKIQLNNFLMHPDIERILCANESIDMDMMLRDGDITVVNIELGDLGPVNSPCFGLFIMVSFINAVLRRPGDENTRLPHFLDVDELPIIMSPAFESCYTLFRKFRCSTLGAIQTLDQFDKNDFLRYMKGVILSNCAHHFVFGRSTVNDQKIFSELGGMKEVTKKQDSYSYNSLASEKPSITTKSQYTTEEIERVSKGGIRERDFQEITCFSVKDGRPLEPFGAKVSFLSKKKKGHVKRYIVDWEKLYSNQKVQVSKDEVEKLEKSEMKNVESFPMGSTVSSVLFSKPKSNVESIAKIETNIHSNEKNSEEKKVEEKKGEEKNQQSINIHSNVESYQGLTPNNQNQIVNINLNNIAVDNSNNDSLEKYIQKNDKPKPSELSKSGKADFGA